MNIFETVCTIIRQQLNIDEELVIEESTQLDELNADSLDAVEIIMALEDEYGIEISDEDAEQVRSVADIVKIISSMVE